MLRLPWSSSDARLPDEQAGRLDLGRHVGDHELDRLVHRDRHAELDALLGVVGGELERRLGDADGHRGHAGARAVEGHHRELEALVLLAEQVVGGDLDVVERDHRGVGGALAELVLLLVHGHAVGVARDDERGDAAVAGLLVGLGVDRVPGGVRAVGDEALGAVDDVLVALLHGGGRMPETSEPASGSVRQKEASLGSSVSMPRYSFLISSEPPMQHGRAWPGRCTSARCRCRSSPSRAPPRSGSR